MQSFPTPGQPLPSNFVPQRRPSNKARWLAIPAVVLVLGASAYGCFVGFDVEAKPHDRELVVTFEDVTAGMGLPKDPARESLKRTFYIDGSVDVLYEYDGSEDKQPIYVSSQVTKTASSSDAEGQYTGMKLGATALFKVMGEDVKEVDRDDLLKFGDKSSTVLLTVPAGNVGNYIVTRKGDKVIMVLFTGVFFDDRESMEKLLMPKLARAASESL